MTLTLNGVEWERSIYPYSFAVENGILRLHPQSWYFRIKLIPLSSSHMENKLMEAVSGSTMYTDEWPWETSRILLFSDIDEWGDGGKLEEVVISSIVS